MAPIMHTTRDYALTPLQYAAQNNDASEVRILLDNGAKINEQDFRDGSTAAHHAAIGGAKAALNVLIEFKANINVKDKTGKTPIMDALIMQKNDLLVPLINANADLSGDFTNGNTLVHYAAYTNNVFALELLLSHNGNPYQANKEGDTPLDKARSYQRTDTTKFLEELYTQNNHIGDLSLSGQVNDNVWTAEQIKDLLD